MNLAAVFPWDFYAIRHADGMTTHGLGIGDISDTVERLAASCVHHVLLVTARAKSGPGCDWCRLRQAMTDAGMVVDVVRSSDWLAYDSSVSSEFLNVDDERVQSASRLILFCQERGVL